MNTPYTLTLLVELTFPIGTSIAATWCGSQLKISGRTFEVRECVRGMYEGRITVLTPTSVSFHW